MLLGAVHGNQEAMDGFVSVVAGTVSPVEFFSPDNIIRSTQSAGRLSDGRSEPAAHHPGELARTQ